MKTIKNKAFALMALMALGMTMQPMFGMIVSNKQELCQSELNEQLLDECEQRDNLQEVIELIKKGADINAKGEFTALHKASIYGNFDIVKCLVEHGADVKIMYNYKKTALQMTSFTDIKNYLQATEDYYNNRTIAIITPQNKDFMPDYCILAAIKGDLNTIIRFESPELDFGHYAKTIQLGDRKDDNGIFEFVWRDLKHKKQLFSTKPVNELIVKNKQGRLVLTFCNLLKSAENNSFTDSLVFTYNK